MSTKQVVDTKGVQRFCEENDANFEVLRAEASVSKSLLRLILKGYQPGSITSNAVNNAIKRLRTRTTAVAG